MQFTRMTGICMVAVALAAGAALAQETTAAPPAMETTAAPPAAAPAMSAEEQAMMDAMMKAGTPGAQHAELAKSAGSWTFTGKFWMNPAKPPMEASGTAERTMMLDGRVLAETVKSEMMGMPFEGHGMSGYDNVTGKYWGTWMDNMSTGYMTQTGTCDVSGCTFTGEYADPMTGKMKKNRSVLRHESADKEVMEGYETGPDGKEYKSMELVFTRKK